MIWPDPHGFLIGGSAKSRKFQFGVIPAQAGIHFFQYVSGCRIKSGMTSYVLFTS